MLSLDMTTGGYRKSQCRFCNLKWQDIQQHTKIHNHTCYLVSIYTKLVSFSPQLTIKLCFSFNSIFMVRRRAIPIFAFHRIESVFCSLVTCTYVGLYGIGLFNNFVPAVTHPDLVHIRFGFWHSYLSYHFYLKCCVTCATMRCIRS